MRLLKPDKQKPRWAQRIIKLRKHLGLSQTDFAKAVGVGQGSISGYEKGEHRPSPDMFVKIASLGEMEDRFFFLEEAGLPKEYFLGGIENTLPSEMLVAADHVVERVFAGGTVKPAVPALHMRVLSISGAAGPGWINDSEYVTGEITLPKGLVPVNGKTVAITLEGDSMEPTIKDGTLVLVDTARNKPAVCVGGIVAAWHESAGVVVKRLVKKEGKLRLASDNVGYQPFDFADGWTISGQVRWWLQEAEGR